MIPPNTTITINGRLGVKGIRLGVLESVPTLPGGLMFCHSEVVPDEENRVEVMLQNVTARTIEISRRQQVACMKSGIILETCNGGNTSTSSSVPGEEPCVDSAASGEGAEIKVNLGDDLTEEENEKVQQVLQKWKEVFAFSSTELTIRTWRT